MANLTAAVKAGGDIPSLVAELKITNAKLVDIRRRLEPQEQHDREELRAALEQRVEEWRPILRKNAAQARQILSQVLGPIMITVEMAEALTQPQAEGFNARRQGRHYARRYSRGPGCDPVVGYDETFGVIGRIIAGPTAGVPKENCTSGRT